MKLHLIRHGKTLANRKRLYCGATDIALCQEGIAELKQLKKTMQYPKGEYFITSGMKRTEETLEILYSIQGEKKAEFQEMNFGQFEMKSYEELKDLKAYQDWISSLSTIDTVKCVDGESRAIFQTRINQGLEEIIHQNKTTVLITHGGVISYIMEVFFPYKKNFYEWQPTYGRGYSIDTVFKTYTII